MIGIIDLTLVLYFCKKPLVQMCKYFGLKDSSKLENTFNLILTTYDLKLLSNCMVKLVPQCLRIVN
jgi:hypothetical protein